MRLAPSGVIRPYFGAGVGRMIVRYEPLEDEGRSLHSTRAGRILPRARLGGGGSGQDELDAGMSPTRETPWRVFVSHTTEMRDYPKDQSYVAAVERAISAAGHVIVDMAGFPAADQPPAELCVERVRECDIYVGVLGTRYGSPVLSMCQIAVRMVCWTAARVCGRGAA